MNFRYLLPRLMRHFMPEFAVRFFLRRGLIIKPGLETKNPNEAVERYINVLADHGISAAGKRVLVFGYGGNFGVGVRLLRAGASHVVLHDKFAIPDDRRNQLLLPDFDQYLAYNKNRIRPLPQFITLLRGDLDPAAVSPVDIVLSNSVYEHLPGAFIGEITRALAGLTRPDGINIHYVDLRDHFFRYPFEMLSYSAPVWKHWLNPTSNLNRFRYSDYEAVFRDHFGDVKIEVLARDLDAFETARKRICPEFLTGDDEMDAVTLLRVIATNPSGN